MTALEGSRAHLERAQHHGLVETASLNNKLGQILDAEGIGAAAEPHFLPAVELTGDAARRAGHGVAVDAGGPAPHGVVRLRDDAGLIALAEPRPGGLLKPVVGFRG